MDSIRTEENQKVHDGQRSSILLSAYYCSPYRGSDHGVGWQRGVHTAKYYNTWILCRKEKNEDDIRKYLASNGEITNLNFCFVPMGRFLSVLKRIPGFFYVAYYFWQRRAYRHALTLHNKVHFSLVHHVNITSFREPGYLWKLNIPFVWGPIGGHQNYPWSFLTRANLQCVMSEGIRNIINMLQYHFSLRVKKVVKKARIILAANTTTKSYFDSMAKQKTFLLLEAGINTITEHAPDLLNRKGPLKIVWSGTFTNNKALDILLVALSKLHPSIKYELTILGDGPLKKRWQKLALRYGVNKHCKWLGWLPKDQAIAYYAASDVLVFTSLRDTSGNVVLEALSNGIPVICLDHQGAGDVITSKCGVKIPVTKPGGVITALCDVVTLLASDRMKLQRLAEGSIERAREYLWSVQIEKTQELYNTILNNT